MLHLITALYRPEFLTIIYDSLPKESDITWHIAKSINTKKLEFEFIDKDKRIIVHEVNCSDSESWKKKQSALDSISEGYFCFLDDDTIFHPNMYKAYRVAVENNIKGMFIGAQSFWGNRIRRLNPSPPAIGMIDTGNVFCDYTSAKSVKFPERKESFNSERDYQFWRDVFSFYDKKATYITDVISIYNELRREHPVAGK